MTIHADTLPGTRRPIAKTEICSGVLIETEWIAEEAVTHLVCDNGQQPVLQRDSDEDAARLSHALWVNNWRARR
jgi:hypothetical protein